jgi:glycosyltransferase involved in cell wall biosynthesis
MRKPKVLVTTSNFLQTKVKHLVYNLCKNIKKYQIVVLTPHHPGAKLKQKIDNMTVYRFKYFPEKHQTLTNGAGMQANIKTLMGKIQLSPFYVCQALAVKRLISMEKPDIIHAYWAIPQGHIISRMSIRQPRVVTCMGSDIYAYPTRTLNALRKNVLNKVDRVISLSTPLKKTIENLGVSTPIDVVPLGVYKEHFKKKKAKKRNTKILLWVGRISEEKGLSYLIRAMPKIKNTELWIIGNTGIEEIENLAVELGLNTPSRHRVLFLGAKPNEELPYYYSQADLFVLPSLSEGFGLVLAEAMMCGLPAVATKVGGVTDIIKDGVNGLVVRPKSSDDLTKKINRLLQDDKLRSKMAANCRKSVSHLYWRNVARMVEGVYDELCA